MSVRGKRRAQYGEDAMTVSLSDRLRRRFSHHDDFYEAIRALGAPTYADETNVKGGHHPSPDKKRVLLVEGIACLNWELVLRNDGASGASHARLRLAIDPGDSKTKAEDRRARWYRAQIAVFYFVIPWVILLATGQFWYTTATGLVLASLLVAGEVIKKDESRFLATLNVLARWLQDDEGITATVPRSWAGTARDADVREFLIQWLCLGREVEAVEEHTAEGVRLRKHLSPVDPRRRTVQSEIEVQRAKRDRLKAKRDELADTIDAVAADLIEAEERRDRERERISRELDEERRERAEFNHRWDQIDARERERAERQEGIDEWFDKGSSFG